MRETKLFSAYRGKIVEASSFVRITIKAAVQDCALPLVSGVNTWAIREKGSAVAWPLPRVHSLLCYQQGYLKT